jgi:hypothetical protein
MSKFRSADFNSANINSARWAVLNKSKNKKFYSTTPLAWFLLSLISLAESAKDSRAYDSISPGLSTESSPANPYPTSSPTVFAGGFTLKAHSCAPAGQLWLCMQGDGDLVLYSGTTSLWATSQFQGFDRAPFTGPTQALSCSDCYASFQDDGNLVLYNPNFTGNSKHAYWRSNTSGNPGAVLEIRGNPPYVSISTSGGQVAWALFPSPATFKAGRCDPFGNLELCMQEDGDLVLNSGGTPVWSTSLFPGLDAGGFTGPTSGLACAGCYAAFQLDGNLVLHNPSLKGTPESSYWRSKISGDEGAVLQITSFPPYVSIVSNSNQIVWSVFKEGTIFNAGHCERFGNLSLCMETDGDFVLKLSGTRIWSTSAFPLNDGAGFTGRTQGLSCASCDAAFQRDGDLVLYNPNFTGNPAHSYWASETSGNTNAFLLVNSKIPYVSIMNGSEAVFPVPARVKRTHVTLDDGSKVTVDNISSQIPADVVAKIVLAADRSTKTGCPFSTPAKGLFAVGDRIVVSDYYVAWFDYTLNDGVEPPAGWAGPSTYPRAGTLAGLWSLNPQTPGPSGAYFAHVAEFANSSKGICSDWPRNELISSSNSPQGQWYWWDKYSPGLQNSMDITESADGSATAYFSGNYAQATAASNFKVTADGTQDSSGNLHYSTSSLLTSNQGTTTFQSALTGETGSIETTFQYIAKEQGVAVLWDFSSTVPTSVNNVFASLWLSYTGQSATTNYPSGHNYPLPTDTFGNLYRHGLSNLGVALSGPVDYAGPDAPLAFRWGAKGNTPCFLQTNYPNCYNIDMNATEPNNAPIRAGDWLVSSQRSANGDAGPSWRLTNVAVPNAGSGARADPIGFPFDRLVTSYESRDLQMSLNITRGPYPTTPPLWFTLTPGVWYRVHYLISPVRFY